MSRPRQLLQVGEPAQRTASQHSQYRDLHHLKALSWMVKALILSSKINLSEWESYVISRAQQAQSLERRWQRFVDNNRIRVKSLYLPVVMAAQRVCADRRLRRLEGVSLRSSWNSRKVYLALDITVLWNRYCMIHLSVICGRRAVPYRRITDFRGS